LWEEFGETTNSKGYKVIDTHVKAIYGDSITVQKDEYTWDEACANTNKE
jgi:hypothetical protein